MGINLRGHHLICLNFFKGKGYDKEFRDYLYMLKKHIKNSEIEIVNGADDVCRKCLYLKNKECKYNPNSEKEIKEMDRTAIRLLSIKQKVVKWKKIEEKLPKIFKDWSAYCKTCDWANDCKENGKWRKLMNLNEIYK